MSEELRRGIPKGVTTGYMRVSIEKKRKKEKEAIELLKKMGMLSPNYESTEPITNETGDKEMLDNMTKLQRSMYDSVDCKVEVYLVVESEPVIGVCTEFHVDLKNEVEPTFATMKVSESDFPTESGARLRKIGENEIEKLVIGEKVIF